MHRWMGWGLLLHGALLGALLGAAGCAGPKSSDSGIDVVYGVVGTACSADITYLDLGAQPTTVTQQALPWHLGFTVPSAKANGFTLSLSAVTQCVTGTITVNIVVNGALYATATSATPTVPAGVQTALF
jgi:hypothetical protein